MLDAALLSAAQAVEHYEITRYGTLTAWAKQLGRQDCAKILHQIMEQEKATDEKLNRIAESNERNNTACNPIRIGATPRLAPRREPLPSPQ